MITRSERDGAVSVQRAGLDPDDQSICICVVDSGIENVVVMSEYNARRVLGMLSVLLDLPLTKTAAREIKL